MVEETQLSSSKKGCVANLMRNQFFRLVSQQREKKKGKLKCPKVLSSSHPINGDVLKEKENLLSIYLGTNGNEASFPSVQLCTL